MSSQTLTRREFVRTGALAAAAVAVGLRADGPTSVLAGPKDEEAVRKTRSYNPAMEYRRLGKTGLWVSAVCLGGHWKRVDKMIQAKGELNPYVSPTNPDEFQPFLKNREAVVHRCLEVGINLIDLAGDSEAEVYSKALGKDRDRIYLAYSHPASEMRVPENRTAKKLVELLKAGLKRCHLEYADVWRCMALERGGRHTPQETEEMIRALDTARKEGLCRFTGLSTHDREWAKMLIETYPDLIQVLCFPYTANSKVLEQHSLFDALRKHDVGALGIKPFSSNALFRGDGSPDGPHVAEDDRRARLTIRYILANPAMTAPIPGLISPAQVDNMAKAVQERRELDAAERADLERIQTETRANLSPGYEWLREWEYV